MDELHHASDKGQKKKSLVGVSRAINASNPLDYRKIRCKGEEVVSNATKTYSLGLAAEQVPVPDEFGVDCLDNLQIIEDDNQAASQNQEEEVQFGAGRKAMSDWLLKYGDITGNANVSKKASAASSGTFGKSANIFSHLLQEANSQSKIQPGSPESDKPAPTNRPSKKAQSKSEGRNTSQTSSSTGSKSASSSVTKKTARPKKSLKKPEKGDGKRT